MKNNLLKILVSELSKNGIASLRYDKRGIAMSKEVSEELVKAVTSFIVRD